MPKKVSKKKEEEEVVVESPVVEKVKKDNFPVVDATGKFCFVPVDGGGAVVYNPAGQRATGIVTLDEAKDIMNTSNRAAHLK